MPAQFLSTDEIHELQSKAFVPRKFGDLTEWLKKELAGRTLVKVECLADEAYTAVIWRFLPEDGAPLLVNGGDLNPDETRL